MNSKEWKNKLDFLLNKYKIYKINNYSLFMEALTHTSYSNENKLNYNYERLEFLGDSVLNWMITSYLYDHLPNSDEGEMTITKSNMVKEETLYKACLKIKLNKLLFLGNGIKREDVPISVLADAFEAFLGAVALDQGINKTFNILNDTIIKYYNDNKIHISKDYKSKFQETIQSRTVATPKYVHNEQGELKKSILKVGELIYGEGVAKSFKEADQLAAKNALDKEAQQK